ncbi:hypothetical protein RSAG8_09224, partial [Rhizoctonia solani AG-8 WAC10335]
MLNMLISDGIDSTATLFKDMLKVATKATATRPPQVDRNSNITHVYATWPHSRLSSKP